MRKLFPIILVLCIAGAWIAVIYRNVNMPAEYEKILADAYDSCESGFYLEAQQYLKEARALRGLEGDYRMEALQRDIYSGMQNENDYEKQLRSMIEDYPEQEENYEKLISYYRSMQDTKELCRYLPEYRNLWPDNAVIKQAAEELDKQYRLLEVGYYDVCYATSSLVNIQVNTPETIEGEELIKRKLVNAKGNEVFSAKYAQMSVAQDGTSCFVCDSDGNWSRVDSEGNLLAKNQKIAFDFIGRLAGNNIATAIVDGQYRFINEKMQIAEPVWEDAGTFINGINAVKKGGGWAFVTTDNWREVTEFPYQDIPRNSQDGCVADGFSVAADEKGYYVVNTQDFLQVSDHVYEEMKAFESGQPTAYRSGDSWGFVDNQGEIFIEACYEDVQPFINGYAAIKQNGLWGYIDKNKTIVVEPQFQEALNVLDSGYAYVKTESGYWSYIIIDKLYYTD